MGRNNVFGIACKTCRRRGRKCDRSLPTCTNCSLRGVVCEGYVLRWVDANVGGSSTGQTYTTPVPDNDLHLAQKRRAPSKPRTAPTGARGVESPPHPHHEAQLVSNAEPPEYHAYVAGSEGSSTHDVDCEDISILRQQNWSILAVVGTGRDGLEGFVEYCTETSGPTVNELY